MGTGHLMRCLALAERLRERDADVRFICRAHPGNLLELIASRELAFAALPAPERFRQPGDDSNAEWLGASQEEDAAQTITALDGGRPDWLVVDHYGIGADWEGSLRSHAAKLLVIDDLANRRHDCDALVDQNFSARGPERYTRRVPEQCELCLGPRFALLRPEYGTMRRRIASRKSQVRRILIFLGGTDPDNLTGRALDALSDPQFGHLEADVVAGANYAHRDLLERQVAARPGTRLLRSRPHLADLMARADLAIGAGGVTTWERMCLGLPSLVVSVADNQVPACEALAAAGLINYLGPQAQVDASTIRAALDDCLREPERLAEQAIGGQAAVDGFGTARVAELMDPSDPGALALRPASADDVHLYFDWVTDPDVRRQSLRSEPIKLSQHRQWFAGKLAEPQSKLFVMEARGLPVGQIRFDRDEGETFIDYSIERLYRGRGWARRLVTLGLQHMQQRDAPVFRADVKESNLRSRAVFHGLGFADSASQGDGKVRVYRLDQRTQG